MIGPVPRLLSRSRCSHDASSPGCTSCANVTHQRRAQETPLGCRCRQGARPSGAPDGGRRRCRKGRSSSSCRPYSRDVAERCPLGYGDCIVTSDERRWLCWSWVGAAAATGGTILGTGWVAPSVLESHDSLASPITWEPFITSSPEQAWWALWDALSHKHVLVTRVRGQPPSFVLVMLAFAMPVADFLTRVVAERFSVTFGTAISIAVVLYVLIPLVSPLVARLIAARRALGMSTTKK